MDAYTAAQRAQIPWSTRWERYRIPARYAGLGLAEMRRTPDIASALDQAHSLVDTWPMRRAPVTLPEDRSLLGRGLILIGPPGVGKTRLMCATATEVAQRYNTAALYMPVTKYFSIGRDKDDSELALKRRALTVPLLLWDDMGKEYDSASGWTGAEVYRILRERFDNQRPTLITTNVPLPEWSSRYEGAMFSFLHEAFDAAVIRGEDQRRARR